MIVDVDGNSLIDLGSGIAVTTVGNAHPQGRRGRCRSRSRSSPTPASWSRRTSSYVVGRRGAQPHHPGRPRQEERAVQLRRRGGGERGEDRPQVHRQAGGRGVRPRLPRPHQPHDGADRQEHAVQERLRAVRRRRSTGCRCRTRYRDGGSTGAGGRQDGHLDRSRSRSAPTTSPPCIIEPIQGEGGFIVPADGFLPALVEWCRAQRASVFIADEIQTGFCPHRATWFACEAERRRARPDHDRQGHRRRAAAGRRDRPGRDHGRRRTRAASAAPTAATRSRCAAALAAIETMFENDGLLERAPRDRATILRGRLARAAGSRPAHRRRARPRRDGRRRVRRSRRRASRMPRSPPRSRKASIAQGVIVLTCGTYGNVMRFLAAAVDHRRPAPRGPGRRRGSARGILIPRSA